MKKWLWAAALCCATAAGAKAPEWVRAEVVKAEPERARVVLKHERIKSIGMEAMTMPFKVAKGVELARFKPGDKVRFTFVQRDDHLMVDVLEPAK
ncbi:copper-binding protein [Caenimonas sedimenti]|nr:copper-binding protein [Caenimonas sedimenti]